VPKLKLSRITVKMAFTTVLIDALHPPFEDAEIALDGVDHRVLAVYIFSDAVKPPGCGPAWSTY